MKSQTDEISFKPVFLPSAWRWPSVDNPTLCLFESIMINTLESPVHFLKGNKLNWILWKPFGDLLSQALAGNSWFQTCSSHRWTCYDWKAFFSQEIYYFLQRLKCYASGKHYKFKGYPGVEVELFKYSMKVFHLHTHFPDLYIKSLCTASVSLCYR